MMTSNREKALRRKMGARRLSGFVSIMRTAKRRAQAPICEAKMEQTLTFASFMASSSFRETVTVVPSGLKKLIFCLCGLKSAAIGVGMRPILIGSSGDGDKDSIAYGNEPYQEFGTERGATDESGIGADVG